MKTRLQIILLTLMLLPLQLLSQQSPQYKDYFTNATLRMDYVRRGCLQYDTVVLQRFVCQNDVWAGSTTQLLDPINNGDYRVLVKDAATGRDLYSRTYNTLFREYRDTGVGRDSVASFEEVVLMPMPRKAIDICLQQRDEKLQFYTTATFRYDPTEQHVGKQPVVVEVRKLLYNGNSHKKIDVVIVAEGYGPNDMAKMQRDFDAFTAYTLGQEPFKSRRDDFNVWGIGAVAEESGVTDPNKGRYVRSAVGSSYNTFGSDRYLMTMHLFQLHDLLAGCPYDHIIIMANCDTYGGGAIYNFYAFSAVQEMSQWILPHELGHSIGGLADEYVDEDIAYNGMHKFDQEPLEANITTLVDFGSKWQSLVPEGTAVPTTPVKGLGPRDCGPVGVYEGAGYKSKGIYRPCTNCMMKYYADFCPVCTRTLNEMFDLYVR